jgi:RNA polymerase sigma-70 factor (ECF subfamily)
LNIISHIKEGNLSVFNEVFQQYHQKLYFFIFNKTKSSFHAEEVTQITFIKLWNYRANLNEELSIDIQIFRIAKTTLIDQLRKINNADKLEILLQQNTEKYAANNGIDNIEMKELQKRIQEILSKMPEARRRVFEMSRIEGQNHKNIAAQLSISIKTVENHINHALKQIRSNLPEILILVALSWFTKNNF